MYSGVPRRDSSTSKGRLLRPLFWILAISFLAVTGYLLFVSDQLDIDTVSVEGNKDISSEAIASEAQSALAGKRYNLFSKNNFFFIDKKDIISRLQNNFNRLEVSSVERKFPKALLIKVEERQPEMVWCSGGVCYLVDKNGSIFSGAGGSDEELKNGRFLTIVDDNAKPVDIGVTVISRDFIDYLKQLDYLLVEDLHLKIDGIYHTPALASQEVLAKIQEENGESWTLKLSSGVSVGETKKILETLFEKELNGDKRASLEYLDLTVKGKIYYKLKVEN